jgi:hypothetical protein
MSGRTIAEYLDGKTGGHLIMAWIISKRCNKLQSWLTEAVNERLEITSKWMQHHIAECPRCQRQIKGSSRLRFALLLIKTQPHQSDLLMRANAQAIGVLKRNIRNVPMAEKLRNIRPKAKFWERVGKYTQSIQHAAACLTILFLLKTGIFSVMTRVQDEGTKTVNKYYSSNLDKDLLDQIL